MTRSSLIDLETGQTLWKSQVPGEPTGRNSSSTPSVADGRVFALGSTQVHCVDAKSGKTLWTAPLSSKGPGSSPLHLPGALVVNAGKLFALDPATRATPLDAGESGRHRFIPCSVEIRRTDGGALQRPE